MTWNHSTPAAIATIKRKISLRDFIRFALISVTPLYRSASPDTQYGLPSMNAANRLVDKKTAKRAFRAPSTDQPPPPP